MIKFNYFLTWFYKKLPLSIFKLKSPKLLKSMTFDIEADNLFGFISRKERKFTFCILILDIFWLSHQDLSHSIQNHWIWTSEPLIFLALILKKDIDWIKSLYLRRFIRYLYYLVSSIYLDLSHLIQNYWILTLEPLVFCLDYY